MTSLQLIQEQDNIDMRTLAATLLISAKKPIDINRLSISFLNHSMVIHYVGRANNSGSMAESTPDKTTAIPHSKSLDDLFYSGLSNYSLGSPNSWLSAERELAEVKSCTSIGHPYNEIADRILENMRPQLNKYGHTANLLPGEY